MVINLKKIFKQFKKIKTKKRFNFKVKNIYRIFARDIKEIRGNLILLLIIGGLCVLPSLYAWFNIEASWDPYGNTKGISVAIVNKDIGANIEKESVNLGDSVVDELKKNNDLGWAFLTSESKATEGVKSGKYYAMIVIPKDFSEKLKTVTEEDVKTANIDYIVNEKLNAIAPKITDKGATSIQLSINQMLVETVSKAALITLGGASAGIEDALPKLGNIEDSLADLNSQLEDLDDILLNTENSTDNVNKMIDNTKNTIPTIQKSLSRTKDLTNDLQRFFDTSSDTLDRLSPNMKNTIRVIRDLSNSFKDSLDELESLKDIADENVTIVKNQINDSLTIAINKIDSILSFNNSLLNMTKGIQSFLKTVHLPENRALNRAIDKITNNNTKLEDIKSDLNTLKIDSLNDISIDQNVLDNIKVSLDGVIDNSNYLYNNFDYLFEEPLDDLMKSGTDMNKDILKLIDQTNDAFPLVNNSLDNISLIVDSTESNLNSMRKSLPAARRNIDKTSDTIEKIRTNKDLQKIIDVFQSDILKRSEFLKEPVKINEKQLFKMGNYGSAMSPFYSVLACWVGVLILVSVLSTSVSGNYTHTEIYWGRSFTYLTLALIQGLIIGIGDVFLLGVQVKHPILFIALLVFSSFVFTYIIYSLVSVFGVIGKAMGIFLLVIQIGGSGGTFPVILAPTFFQTIHKIIPFTYAISACREAVGGIYPPALITDIKAMFGFLFIFIILALFLKKPINNFFEPFGKKFSSSSLIGH